MKEPPKRLVVPAPQMVRNQRARKQAGLEPLAASRGGWSFLERHAVGQPTGIDYHRRIRRLEAWLGVMSLAPSTDEEIDAALADYLDMEFAQGAVAPEANKLLSAIGHCWQRFSRHGAGAGGTRAAT